MHRGSQGGAALRPYEDATCVMQESAKGRSYGARSTW
jgi:hypothetical protein